VRRSAPELVRVGLKWARFEHIAPPHLRRGRSPG
jgi:hypothetical protein